MSPTSHLRRAALPPTPAARLSLPPMLSTSKHQQRNARGRTRRPKPPEKSGRRGSAHSACLHLVSSGFAECRCPVAIRDRVQRVMSQRMVCDTLFADADVVHGRPREDWAFERGLQSRTSVCLRIWVHITHNSSDQPVMSTCVIVIWDATPVPDPRLSTSVKCQLATAQTLGKVIRPANTYSSYCEPFARLPMRTTLSPA